MFRKMSFFIMVMWIVIFCTSCALITFLSLEELEDAPDTGQNSTADLCEIVCDRDVQLSCEGNNLLFNSQYLDKNQCECIDSEPSIKNCAASGQICSNGACINNTNNTDNCVPAVDQYTALKDDLFIGKCVNCHTDSGPASFTRFTIDRTDDAETRKSIKVVIDAQTAGVPLILAKPSNQAGHTGGKILQTSDELYKKLETMVNQVKTPAECDEGKPFSGVSF